LEFLSVNRVNLKLEVPVFPVRYMMDFEGHCFKPASFFGGWGSGKEPLLGLNILQANTTENF
jgi:hypothetical protein